MHNAEKNLICLIQYICLTKKPFNQIKFIEEKALT